MSVQSSFLPATGRPPENGMGAEAKTESVYREMRYLLTLNTQAGKGYSITCAGLAHSFGVCLVEAGDMARGKGRGTDGAIASGMPRFVDVKLTPEQRTEFGALPEDVNAVLTGLRSVLDSGYRVGCSWSGEHQSYTVSLTCREANDPNNGLCMTAFAGTLLKALSLALYKHVVVTNTVWASGADSPSDLFG